MDDLNSSNTPKVGDVLAELFAGDLNPVAPKAQRKVPVPEGLDLDAWINPPPSESDSNSENEDMEAIFIPKSEKEQQQNHTNKYVEPSADEVHKMKEARRIEQMNNPHYLKGEVRSRDIEQAMEVIPLDLNVSLKIHQRRSDRYLAVDRQEKHKSKKSSKKGKQKKEVESSSEDEVKGVVPSLIVSRNMDMPEGATFSDSNSSQGPIDDPHRALNIDLDT